MSRQSSVDCECLLQLGAASRTSSRSGDRPSFTADDCAFVAGGDRHFGGAVAGWRRRQMFAMRQPAAVFTSV
jgi:hypothetical protein